MRLSPGAQVHAFCVIAVPAGAFADSGIPGTPNVQLDGTEIPSAQLATAAAYIDANRKK